jgi:hypothetical protein
VSVPRAACAGLALAAAVGCSDPPPRPCGPAPGGLETVCGLARPEDLAWVASKRVLLASEMGFDAPLRGGGVSVVEIDSPERTPRRLWPSPQAPRGDAGSLRGDPSCGGPPDPDGFSGHGLDAAAPAAGAAEVPVAVVAHGAREAVELFDLRGEGSSLELVWRGCVPLPVDTAGNDVAIGANGALYVTNYIPTVHGLRALLALRRAARGETTGDVLAWSPQRGWRHLAGTEAAQPNGIALAAEGDVLLVAENGRRRLMRLSLRSGERITGPELSGHPDNLSWTERGTLLAALLLPETPGRFEIAEVDPVSLAAETRFAHDGSAIHSVTSAVEVEGALFLGSMADDRMGVWRPEPRASSAPE